MNVNQTNKMHNRGKRNAALRWASRLAAFGVLAGLGIGSARGDDAPATQPTTLPAAAAGPLVATGLSAAGDVSLMVNRSTVVTTRAPYKRVSVGNPELVDVNLVGPSEVLLTAKKPGATQLVIWDDSGRSQVVDVGVGYDLRAMQEQFKALFPTSQIESSSANGVVVLKGRVPNLQTGVRAAQVAAPYGTSVLNFLEVSGGQEVMLQVRFAEVSRSLTQNLGFNAFATDGRFNAGIQHGPGATPIGALATGSSASTIPPVSIFGSGRVGDSAFEFFLDALKQNNLLRVLAEPNLVAISGEPASFLAGGKFPVPVPQTSGGGGTAITVDYKEFGVRLNFTPTVLGNGHIRLDVAPEVSDLDFTQSVSFNGFVIPSITTRNVKTTVELNEGQTFALAGLLNNRVTANRSSTPLLGDIPILGALFRSVRYVRDETELVVLVTPRVVSPMNPGQIPRLPGEVWRHPTEAQLFALGDLGGPAPDMANAPAVNAPPYKGRYGFTPAQPTSSPAQ